MPAALLARPGGAADNSPMMPGTSPARPRLLLERFRGKRIGVVGDYILDRFIRGSVLRISPEAPVPVVVVREPETAHLGGAGNVVANLSELGAHPAAFGVVGRDKAGRTIRQELHRRGIKNTGLLTDAARPTSVKTRIIADHQQVARVDWEQTAPLPADLEKALLGRFRAAAPRLDAVVVSDYDKGVLTETLLPELLAISSRQRLPVFVDLKKARRFDSEVRLVLLNQRRAEEFTGLAITDDTSLELAGRALRARFPSTTLVISRGAKGLAVFDKGNSENFQAVRTKPWEVFDVTGAGDTVLATLTLALLSGASPRQAAALANAAAGVVVGKLGTAVCSPAELLRNLAPNRPP